VTARTPYQAGGGDVSTTLGELERKLRELEQELNTTARPADAAPAAPSVTTSEAAGPSQRAAPSAPPAPAPAAPPAAATGRDADAMIAQARARLGTLDGQVDELLRFREQLQRTARELEDEYSRVLARIGAPTAPPSPEPPAPAAAQPAAPTPPPVPGAVRAPIASPVDPAALLPNHPAFAQPEQTLNAPVVNEYPPGASVLAHGAEVEPIQDQEPPPPPAMPPIPVGTVPPAPVAAAPAAPPAPAPHEDTLFEGAIVLDAGPFTDIAALSAFEQGLARVRGAEDVYVSGFEGNRALIELRLAQPVTLVQEMRTAVPGGFTVTDAAAGRLRLDVTAITPGS
jgi:hypothetical protein